MGATAKATRLAGGNARPQAGRQRGRHLAEIVVENQHGDPRYLDEARKALADLRKLWGLDAPQKVDVRASRNPYADMTEEALRERTRRAKRACLGDADRSTPAPDSIAT